MRRKTHYTKTRGAVSHGQRAERAAVVGDAKCEICGRLLLSPEERQATGTRRVCGRCQERLEQIGQGGANPDVYPWFTIDEPPAPLCKHGLHKCDRCGQRSTDATHMTVGGKGRIGRL